MVKKQQYKGKSLFRCGSCSLLYLKEAIAYDCEVYCKKHKSCSLEISKQAVRL
ncbi:MAG: hypothetical protein AABX05_05695 [Nanoarchaeota archaeon]